MNSAPYFVLRKPGTFTPDSPWVWQEEPERKINTERAWNLAADYCEHTANLAPLKAAQGGEHAY